MDRRSFLKSTTCLALSTASLTLILTPKIAKAWVAEAIAIAQIAYSLYTASQGVGRTPDVKLGLLLEVLGQIRGLHQQVANTNKALGEIIILLVNMPKKVQKSFRDELDDYAADQLVSSCQSVIEEVQRLQALYSGQQVSSIPDTKLRDLRDFLNLVRDRRNTLFLRTDLSALALCASAIVELSAERFLGLVRDEAEVTAYAYLAKFVEMESEADPKSLHSIYKDVSSTLSNGGFTRNALLPHVFSRPDLRPEIRNDDGWPTGVHKDVKEVRKYIASQIYYQNVDFIRNGKLGYIFYNFPDGGRFHLGRQWIKCSGKPCAVGSGVQKAGLDDVNIPIQIDHYCAKISLEVIEDRFDPRIQYTTVSSVELETEKDRNTVRANEQLQYWDDYSTASTVDTEPDPFAWPGESVEGDPPPSDVFVTEACKTGQTERIRSRLDDVAQFGQREKALKELKADLTLAQNNYNERVHLVRALAALISVVDRTSEEIRGRIKEWGA